MARRKAGAVAALGAPSGSSELLASAAALAAAAKADARAAAKAAAPPKAKAVRRAGAAARPAAGKAAGAAAAARAAAPPAARGEPQSVLVALSLVQLRDALRAQGLKVSGTKPELLLRLAAAAAPAADAPRRRR